jgi:hypothetical protein
VSVLVLAGLATIGLGGFLEIAARREKVADQSDKPA